MAKADISDIISQVEKLLEDPSLFLVEASLNGHGNQQKLKVLIDGDKGVTIDQCATISRKLGHWLEENDVINGAYQLEVSSPGLDLPLKQMRQYRKNAGRKVKVIQNEGKELKGTLEEVSEQSITLKIEKKKKETELVTIPFENIQQTKVLVTF